MPGLCGARPSPPVGQKYPKSTSAFTLQHPHLRSRKGLISLHHSSCITRTRNHWLLHYYFTKEDKTIKLLPSQMLDLEQALESLRLSCS